MYLKLYIDSCNSTNDLMLEYTKNLTNKLTNFSYIYTFNQLKGRGQYGNIWLSEPKKNIAITFYLKKIISFDVIFYSFFIIVHLRNFLSKFIPNNKLWIKWSNDLIVNNKKICGILIEKQNNNLIIGIGINCNQTKFPINLNGISLKNINFFNYNLHEIAINLHKYFFDEYQKIQFIDYNKYYNKILLEYHNYLFQINQITTLTINNTKILGTILKVDKRGHIHIQFQNGKIQTFKNKEILINY